LQYLPKNGPDSTSPNPSVSSPNPESISSDVRERERSQESEVLEKAYRELMEEHRLLKVQLVRTSFLGVGIKEASWELMSATLFECVAL
jgi:hypothetical protein